MAVVLDHAVGVEAHAGGALCLRLEPGPDMHPRRVHPDEEGLVGLNRTIDEIHGGREKLLVRGFHALAGHGPRVLDLAVRRALDHATRPEARPELRVLRIVIGLRLLFRVEVIEIAEELVEAVIGRQVLVPVAKMVLAELAGGIAVVLQQIGDGRAPLRYAVIGAGHADGQKTRSERVLPEDERRASGRAALLGVVVREQRAFLGDAIDVGRLVPHHAQVVGADVAPSHVVAPDHQDVRLFLGPRGC